MVDFNGSLLENYGKVLITNITMSDGFNMDTLKSKDRHR